MEIVVNADDFGLSQDVNHAIAYCFEHNLIQRTSLIVNMPCSDEAVEMAKKSGYDNRIGLHINLVEGLPLTDDIKNTAFCDKDGTFNGSIMNGKKRLIISKQEKRAVEKEICAQIVKYYEYGLKLNHIDSHRHVHTNYPVLIIILNIMNKNLISCNIRLSRNIPSDAVAGIKGIYKRYINAKIVDFNKKNDETVYSTCFGSIDDYDNYIDQGGKLKNIEIMVHPIMRDKVLADAINDFSIEEWCKGKIKL